MRGLKRNRVHVGRWVAAAVVSSAVVVTPSAAQDAESMEIPMRIEDDRILVPVEIGHGVEVDFILSTGNAVTVLNQAFIDNHGADGDFWLGDVELNMDHYATVSNAELNPDGGMIVGIVGANTLNEFDLLIDPLNDRVVLQTVGRAVEWDGVELGDPTRLRVYHGIMLGLDVDLVGRSFPAMIDTGTGRVVGSPAVGDALGIPLGEQGSSTIEWASGEATDVRVHIRDLSLFDRWDPEGKGFLILGSSLAYDCALSISWLHREMRRCPGSQTFGDAAARGER
ncbi:MAG: hypothetical protein AAF389_03660 [Gemmatimonadota bacterium]